MNTSTCYLLRHGETVWNRDGNRYAGLTDVPLTGVGRDQAVQAARELASIEFDAIFSSTLSRTRDTAMVIAKSRNMAVVSDPRLDEMNYGQWEGRTHEGIRTENPGQWEAWAGDPATHRAGETGETAVDVYERMNAFMAEAFGDGQAILMVGHHTSMRVFLAGSLGMPLSNYRRLSIDNLGMCVLERSDWGLIWRGINQRWIERT